MIGSSRRASPFSFSSRNAACAAIWKVRTLESTSFNAMVPLANMFGYVNTLRSMSQGRAQYTMHFDHYEKVPQAVADEVKAKMA